MNRQLLFAPFTIAVVATFVLYDAGREIANPAADWQSALEFGHFPPPKQKGLKCLSRCVSL
jgi:hypothetical protein